MLAQRPSKRQPLPSLPDLYSQMGVHKGERKFRLKSVHWFSSQESYFIILDDEGKFQGALFIMVLHLRAGWSSLPC